MSEYNIEMADKAFIRKAAYLARDLDYDPENPPTSRQVELWRSNTMEIIQQHQTAHKYIRELITKLSELEDKLNEIIEIYAGMEGFEPETAPEAYLLRIVEQMYRTAISGLDCDE